MSYVAAWGNSFEIDFKQKVCSFWMQFGLFPNQIKPENDFNLTIELAVGVSFHLSSSKVKSHIHAIYPFFAHHSETTLGFSRLSIRESVKFLQEMPLCCPCIQNFLFVAKF